MLRKILGLSALLVLASASAATAGYETPTVTGTVVDGTVVVTGTGCMPAETVTYSVASGATVTSVAAATGAFSADVPLGGLTGNVNITVTCGSVVQVLGVVVGASPVRPARTLAFTGSDSTTGVAIAGAVLVVAGAGAIALSRRRRVDVNA